MKSLFLITAVLLGCASVWAQEEKPIESCRPAENPFGRLEKQFVEVKPVENAPSQQSNSDELLETETAATEKFAALAVEKLPRTERFAFVEAEKEPLFVQKAVKRASTEDFSSKDATAQQNGEEKFHWKPALIQSGFFLGIQHVARMYESKTRRELDGPFFRDYKNSVKNLRGWDDGGKFFTNYVAHPMQGGVTGRIFVNNSDRANKQEFGKSKAYWASRMKAMAWSAVWSTQFEIGPVSEASLGNVGLVPHPDGRSRLTWGDLVITPVVGTGWVIAEDMVDKYVLRNWIERKSSRKTSVGVKIARSFLTPTTSFANLLRGKMPWKRDFRPN